MYFGSVKFFKHVIVLITLLLIIIPTVICFVLGAKSNGLSEENEKLRSEINEYRLSGDKKEYEDEELFELYRESLDDKEGFLKLAYDYDPELYKAAENAKADTLPAASNSMITAAPVTTEELTNSGTVNISEEPEESGESEFHTAVNSYELLYPDLYADVPENIIYNDDMDYVYLTFDDGPSKYTQSILDYLDMYDIKATFFVVPDGSEESNKRLKNIADKGHTIGIHTATHEYNKIYESVEAYLEDFKIAYDRVYEATGIKCTLFRFPGGSINDYNTEIREDLIAEMTRRGFIYFDWNVDTSDALGATWTEMYNNVRTQTIDKNRAVILMHDYNGGYNTILVLEDIIKWIIGNGQRTFHVGQLSEFVKPVQF
ncbi:MAG: polysaccharide deacetylase [Ruminiclostridium sp.]|nr:polysaccharide deacetylase [Ruminiclostridium sp.]